MRPHLLEEAGSVRINWVVLTFAAALVGAAVMIAVLLAPSFERGELDLVSSAPAGESASGAAAGDGAEALSSAERRRVGTAGDDGEAVPISGTVYFKGSPLANVALLALIDVPATPPPSLRRFIKSSPLFYGAKTAEVLGDTDLLRTAPAPRPFPAAACRTAGDGKFTLAVPKARTVTFELDHDFYFLPSGAAGPLAWQEAPGAAAGAALDGFDGMLSAELGALIEGAVTDWDGVPLAGAVVALVDGALDGGPPGRGFFGRGDDAFAERETVTDEEGGFVFRGVEAGREVRLLAQLDGFAPEESKIFEAQAGQTVRERLRLLEGSAIRVEVRGPDGAAVARAEVFLEQAPEQEANGSGGRGGRGGFGPGMFGMENTVIAGASRTGADGAAAFAALAPGSYSVRACFPGMVEARTATPIAVGEQAAAHAVRLDLAAGDAIAGMVVDDAQRPVAGARVQALPRADSGGDGFGGGGRDFVARMRAAATPAGALKEAASAADGSFTITGLTPSELYDLFAGAKGKAPAEQREIKPGAQGVVLVMARTGQVRGRVIAVQGGGPVPRFSVRIVPAPEDDEGRGPGRWGDRFGGRQPPGGGRGGDGAGQESADPRRRLFDSFGELMRTSGPPSFDLTDREQEFADRDGRFELSEIVPGRYRLCVFAKAHAPTLTEPFEIEKGQTIDGLVVGLDPGASISGKTTSDRGAVAGALLRVDAERGQPDDLDMLIRTAGERESDGDGAFVIDGLPPGRFTVRATHRDYPDVSIEAIQLDKGQAETGVDVRFPPAAKIVGVAYGENGLPLADQMVLCRSGGGGGGSGGGPGGGGRREFRNERTDRDGRFEFGELAAGTYTVSIGSQGMGFRFGGGGDEGGQEVRLLEGDVAEIVLVREPPEGVRVHGVVSDDAGPVSRGMLSVAPVRAGGRESREGARTGAIEANGSYLVEGVTPGANRFTVRLMTGEGFESTTLDLEVPDVLDHLLDITLPGGRISGVVRDQITGQPLEGVRVSLSTDGEEQPGGRGGGPGGGWWGGGRAVTTSSDGAFLFRLLSPGTYTLSARPPDRLKSAEGFGYFTTEVGDIVVAEGQPRDNVNVIVGPGGGVRLVVVDPSDAPFEGATVTVHDPDGGPQPGRGGGMRGRTGEDGVAVINGVKPGLYTLTIQARQMAQQAIGGVSVVPGRFVEQRVRIEPGFAVSVRLVDAEGQPVERAALTLKDAAGAGYSVPGGRFGRGDANVYSLGNLVSGRYTIEANWQPQDAGAGGKKGSAVINVSGAETITATLQ